MSYIATDRSTQDGEPILLYQFSRGSTSWRYTSAAYAVTTMGYTWTPAPIKNSDFKQTNQVDKDKVTLTFPSDHEFASQFLGYVPEQITSVTIWRGHDSDGNYVVRWKGRITSPKPADEKISIECQPISVSLKRNGLTAKYQKACRHVLYGRGCNLDKSDWGASVIVTGGSGSLLVIDDLNSSAYGDGYFNGGMIETGEGVYRYILSHVGDTIQLIRPVEHLINDLASDSGYGNNYGNVYGGVGVTIYPGCDHSMPRCLNFFDNLDNHGGFGWMGGSNPFSKSVF